jgi:hypothetical protein
MTLKAHKPAPKQYKRYDRLPEVERRSNPHRMGEHTMAGSNYTARKRHPLSRLEKIQKAQNWNGRTF